MFQLKNILLTHGLSADPGFADGFFVPGYAGDPGGLQISFFDCVPAQDPVITVCESFRSVYRFLERKAARLSGWITVKTVRPVRTMVRHFRRTLCAAAAVFNRTVFVRQGGLRL